ncbi:unnamed protein product [Trichogramma brassicae]|uniref:CCHC-type domain-containing protein n=1 Tax=Trichogramma brassicae TaxID=86971 RepID=A0A6H5IHN6_9HYME|nr:unnamed protein product [Trichogramma brassicae]
MGLFNEVCVFLRGIRQQKQPDRFSPNFDKTFLMTAVMACIRRFFLSEKSAAVSGCALAKNGLIRTSRVLEKDFFLQLNQRNTGALSPFYQARSTPHAFGAKPYGFCSSVTLSLARFAPATVHKNLRRRRATTDPLVRTQLDRVVKTAPDAEVITILGTATSSPVWTQLSEESVTRQHLCFNCLRPGHAVQTCPSRSTCQTCGTTHHSLLHEGSRKRSASSQKAGPSAKTHPTSFATLERVDPRPSSVCDELSTESS